VEIDWQRFGPWALVTGASPGIGAEFARQIAASGINMVLAVRRQALLIGAGAELSKAFAIRHRVVGIELSQEGCIPRLAAVTDDLDVGLVVSNACTASSGAPRIPCP
jgi:uncharacterized protein